MHASLQSKKSTGSKIQLKLEWALRDRTCSKIWRHRSQISVYKRSRIQHHHITKHIPKLSNNLFVFSSDAYDICNILDPYFCQYNSSIYWRWSSWRARRQNLQYNSLCITDRWPHTILERNLWIARWRSGIVAKLQRACPATECRNCCWRCMHITWIFV